MYYNDWDEDDFGALLGAEDFEGRAAEYWSQIGMRARTADNEEGGVPISALALKDLLQRLLDNYPYVVRESGGGLTFLGVREDEAVETVRIMMCRLTRRWLLVRDPISGRMRAVHEDEFRDLISAMVDGTTIEEACIALMCYVFGAPTKWREDMGVEHEEIKLVDELWKRFTALADIGVEDDEQDWWDVNSNEEEEGECDDGNRRFGDEAEKWITEVTTFVSDVRRRCNLEEILPFIPGWDKEGWGRGWWTMQG
jgi:hypothetical protein